MVGAAVSFGPAPRGRFTQSRIEKKTQRRSATRRASAHRRAWLWAREPRGGLASWRAMIAGSQEIHAQTPRCRTGSVRKHASHDAAMKQWRCAPRRVAPITMPTLRLRREEGSGFAALLLRFFAWELTTCPPHQPLELTTLCGVQRTGPAVVRGVGELAWCID